MTKRTVLTADKGYVLTDGTVYGKVIYPADDKTEDDYTEITDAEYEEIENEKLKMENEI